MARVLVCACTVACPNTGAPAPRFGAPSPLGRGAWGEGIGAWNGPAAALRLWHHGVGRRSPQLPERSRVPPTAQRLDQEHAGREAPAEEIEGGALVVERDRLQRNHVEKAHGSGLVLIERELDRLARAAHRRVLQRRLLL